MAGLQLLNRYELVRAALKSLTSRHASNPHRYFLVTAIEGELVRQHPNLHLSHDSRAMSQELGRLFENGLADYNESERRDGNFYPSWRSTEVGGGD